MNRREAIVLGLVSLLFPLAACGPRKKRLVMPITIDNWNRDKFRNRCPCRWWATHRKKWKENNIPAMIHCACGGKWESRASKDDIAKGDAIWM